MVVSPSSGFAVFGVLPFERNPSEYNQERKIGESGRGIGMITEVVVLSNAHPCMK